MNRLTRTIIVLTVLSLAMSDQAKAQTNAEAQKQTFTISGNAGIDGVKMMGLPGNPVTDDRGSYSVAVSYGWSGTVTPRKEGYNFKPSSKVYSNLISDLTGENYSADIMQFKISGSVAMEGVTLKGLPGKIVSEKDGKYKATVSYGWTGMIMPVKADY